MAAIQFWEGSANTFHIKCGMITSTLLDIAAITGLKLTGRVFNHGDAYPISLKFDVGDSGKLAYNNFIDYHAKTSGPVTPEEHVAFLTLRLSCFVFCSRSMQIAKQFLYLDTQLHQGHGIDLGQLILASLYESLSDVVSQIKIFDPTNSKKKNVLAHGPFWFLQLWLNAIFSKDIRLYGMRRVACPPVECHVV